MVLNGRFGREWAVTLEKVIWEGGGAQCKNFISLTGKGDSFGNSPNKLPDMKYIQYVFFPFFITIINYNLLNN